MVSLIRYGELPMMGLMNEPDAGTNQFAQYITSVAKIQERMNTELDDSVN
jgi:hypothetical protein